MLVIILRYVVLAFRAWRFSTLKVYSKGNMVKEYEKA